MRILITGSNGFIGSNLKIRLSELAHIEYVTYSHSDGVEVLEDIAADVDAVIHLAGVNRPKDPAEYALGNHDFTEQLCRILEKKGSSVHVLFASSSQALLDNPYGKSKRDAEKTLEDFASMTGSVLSIYRLPNVFGKWCRPEYNSVVATFCHHIANNQAIEIRDPGADLRLVYVDDVITSFLEVLAAPEGNDGLVIVSPEYSTTVGGLADMLHQFRDSRESLVIDGVGTGLKRALYATYLTYLHPGQFSYALDENSDDRGRFVEVLKTPGNGQFSFFTARPGATRGGHYHHTKTEKFLVVQGEALFRFRHLVTNQCHEIRTSARDPVVVETIPGWAHDITNAGDIELVVILWANEIFDKNKPDTVKASLDD
jgi:UDP-2-acetamido-2,6-beta-L-arabino-hexul-4-ose reductase